MARGSHSFLFDDEVGRVAVNHISYHVDVYIKLIYNRREQHWQWGYTKVRKNALALFTYLLCSPGQPWLLPFKQLNNKFMTACKSFSVVSWTEDAIHFYIFVWVGENHASLFIHKWGYNWKRSSSTHLSTKPYTRWHTQNRQMGHSVTPEQWSAIE